MLVFSLIDSLNLICCHQQALTYRDFAVTCQVPWMAQKYMPALWYQTLGSVRPLVAFVLSSLPHWQINLFAIKGALQVTAVSL